MCRNDLQGNKSKREQNEVTKPDTQPRRIAGVFFGAEISAELSRTETISLNNENEDNNDQYN
jgi:hypothetical protein